MKESHPRVRMIHQTPSLWEKIIRVFIGPGSENRKRFPRKSSREFTFFKNVDELEEYIKSLHV